MKYISKYYATKDSPMATKKWLNLSNDERLSMLKKVSNDYDSIKFTRTTDLGYVYVKLEDDIDAGDRGVLLLQLEKVLKFEIDECITIWHEPIGDRSSLRMLRGIKIKTK
jgi:hypothetical protein